MDIESVELFTPSEEQQILGAYSAFKIRLNNDVDSVSIDVPLDKNNRHYWEVKEWYDKQEIKPFEFDFDNPDKLSDILKLDEDSSS